MPQLTRPVTAEDHLLGPENAPVTLVEYGDFECPHCASAHPVLKELLDRCGQRLRFAYRHFPMQRSHPNAQQAAEAAEAAGRQGKFWEMHDLLFRNQSALATEDLVGYAREAGLDVERFERELTGREYEDEVREDFLSGVRSGVNGTPTLYINGERYDGRVALEPLLEAVERAEQQA